jgi:hypothetical protein
MIALPQLNIHLHFSRGREGRDDSPSHALLPRRDTSENYKEGISFGDRGVLKVPQFTALPATSRDISTRGAPFGRFFSQDFNVTVIMQHYLLRQWR